MTALKKQLEKSILFPLITRAMAGRVLRKTRFIFSSWQQRQRILFESRLSIDAHFATGLPSGIENCEPKLSGKNPITGDGFYR